MQDKKTKQFEHHEHGHETTINAKVEPKSKPESRYDKLGAALAELEVEKKHEHRHHVREEHHHEHLKEEEAKKAMAGVAAPAPTAPVH